MHNEINDSAVFHTGSSTDERNRNIELNFFSCMENDKIDMTNTIGKRIELYFTQNALRLFTVEVKIDDMSFAGIDERTKIQLFYVKRNRSLTVSVKNSGDSSAIAQCPCSATA